MTDEVFIQPHPPTVLVDESDVMFVLDQSNHRVADGTPDLTPRIGNSITDLQEQVAMLGDLITQQMTHIQRLETRQDDLFGEVAVLLVSRDQMRRQIENLEKDMAQAAEMLGRSTQSIAALRDEADHVEGFIAGHKKVHEERGLTGKWNFRARSPKS